MTILYLLRHAKAARARLLQPDSARGLDARGRAAADAMGAWLAREAIRPDLVLCSTARRTRETLEAVERAAGWPASAPERRFDERLYHAAAGGLLACLREVPATTGSTMLVGHNPGLHELALTLADAGADDYAALSDKFPTGALVVLETDIAWPELSQQRPMRLRRFVCPRDLREGRVAP